MGPVANLLLERALDFERQLIRLAVVFPSADRCSSLRKIHDPAAGDDPAANVSHGATALRLRRALHRSRRRPGNRVEDASRPGWSGRAYDLNAQSLAAAAQLNRLAVSEGRYQLEQRDWLEVATTEPVDLVVSCMVLEHLAEADEARYLEHCRRALKPRGLGVLFVPGCPDYWGMEDEVAGHFRRYTFQSLQRSIEARGLRVGHVAGLT